jgi:UDP-N-acetylglucosamine 4-epimerase
MGKKDILVTGGAGFIGSNLVGALLNDDRVGRVRVLDNLSTGFMRNIEGFQGNPNFEFLLGDIRDYNTCTKACKDFHYIAHQAALGSVPRSIKDPITSNEVNISGTLNVYTAAKETGIKRVVYAASSSTYGDSKELPKVEDRIGRPLSPYAVTKLVNEQYARVFADLYNMELIGLRYFNVFGPRQNPNGAYAAVIPLFINAAIDNKAPFINGDGSYSRDFTYVANAVQANILALFTENENAVNQIYNVAFGERTTLNELWHYIKEVSGTVVTPEHRENRIGDIPHSLADISKAKKYLKYNPQVDVKKGLEKAFEWYSESIEKND